MAVSNIQAVFLCGVSASGKSTLAALLHGSLRCDIISIGEIIRAQYTPQQILSEEIDSEDFFSQIRKRIEQRNTNLVIIDNFPYSIEQYNIWLKYFPPPILTLHIKSNNASLRKSLRGRLDDNFTDIISRHNKFQKYTIPAIEYLKVHSSLIEINGDQLPRKLLEESINLIHEILINRQTLFHDFSTPVIFQRLSISAKPLIRKGPFKSGYRVYLPDSIYIPPSETQCHSILVVLEVGSRSIGLLTGVIANKGALVHPTFIESGAEEIKITITNLTSVTILIDAGLPIAEITFLPVLIPIATEAKVIKYGYQQRY